MFANAAVFAVTGDSWPTKAMSIAFESLAVLWPIAAMGVIVAILANLLQTGPILSMEPLTPKFERINPVAGFKRIFNSHRHHRDARCIGCSPG